MLSHNTFAVILIVGMVLPGCGYDPLDPHTQLPQRRSDLVGLWKPYKPDKEISHVLSSSKAIPVLVLHDDGTFTARDIPDGMNRAVQPITTGTKTESFWKLVSGSGNWQLKESQNHWVIYLNFSKPTPSDPGKLIILDSYHQKPPLQLGIGLGDPDEGRVLMLHKCEATKEGI